AALAGGIAALVGFAIHERRTPAPMVPPTLFASRSFLGANVLTLLLYLGVAGVFFVLPFNLVQVQGYSSTATGAAFLPFALVVGVLSRRGGALADRIGTRPLLVAGPAVRRSASRPSPCRASAARIGRRSSSRWCSPASAWRSRSRRSRPVSSPR